MGLINQVKCVDLKAMSKGGINFFTLQNSHETILVEVPPKTIDHLFCHRFQTDRLIVVRGSVVFVYLQDRKYHYLPLTQQLPTLVEIPPGIPHAAINLTTEPCLIVNAVIRHGIAHPKDYHPIKQPYPFDLKRVEQLMKEIAFPLAVPS